MKTVGKTFPESTQKNPEVPKNTAPEKDTKTKKEKENTK